MANFSEILVDIASHVATVTLNRPTRGNAVTPTMTRELMTAFEKLSADSSVRVIVLTGSGKFFCTGMDLSATSKASSSTGGQPKASSPLELFETIFNCPKPVICQLNGPALGGGAGLVFVCDLRVALRSASLAFPEVKRGIVPALISAYVVPQLGPVRSMRYFLTGQAMSAGELHAIGVVSALADDAAALATATSHCVDLLLDSGPAAMATIKWLVHRVALSAHQDNKAYVQQVFADMMQSDEAAYGFAQFLQKQKPNWTEFYASKSKL
eukprot:TRINITY_DN7486_c0_g1_i1.p1 TRINITY_DN7486_c0_g1~~TRINITY_DN7486_c0_g1_i1.p1  ORF type:complete len:269 (-),score=58.79 TRINITY_DN7486_c0_g1_i1:144-950(-)